MNTYKRIVTTTEPDAVRLAEIYCGKIGAAFRPVRTGETDTFAIEGDAKLKRKIDLLVDEIAGFDLRA